MGKRRLLFINPPVLAVDRFQVLLYAESIPFGLLQIATYELSRGNDVEFFDMMGYLEAGFENVIAPENRCCHKRAGSAQVSGLTRPVYLYGLPMSALQEKLARMEPPDEVYVTTCISFNWELAHQVVALCRAAFPKTRILLGGFYATAFPEHAARSGADVVHQGRHLEAEAHPPRLDLLSARPSVWLFRIVMGCRYRCSFCLNSFYKTEIINEPAAVVQEIMRIRSTTGIRNFSCWDPNVMLESETMLEFLALMARERSDVRLNFEMGIQPDRLTPDFIQKMMQAGVEYMTIPFESSEAAMMKRFGKVYRMQHSMDAVAQCRSQGFDTSRFHCTWVVGIPGEGYRHIFRTYFGVLKAGGFPTPFPITVSPGTREYTRHKELVAGKELDELNGHLWPLQGSAKDVERYERMFEVINQPTAEKAASLALNLEPEARDEFFRQMDWYLKGPHVVGDKVD